MRRDTALGIQRYIWGYRYTAGGYRYTAGVQRNSWGTEVQLGVQRYSWGTEKELGVQRISWGYKGTVGNGKEGGGLLYGYRKGSENKAVFKDHILKGGSAEQLAKILIKVEKYLTANTNIC